MGIKEACCGFGLIIYNRSGLNVGWFTPEAWQWAGPLVKLWWGANCYYLNNNSILIK